MGEAGDGEAGDGEAADELTGDPSLIGGHERSVANVAW